MEDLLDVLRFRVLVVDDLKDGADTLATMLRLMGHDTRTAYDGEAGLEAALAWRPDVVLLDLAMPRMNGYEVCRRLRQEPWGRNLLVIALTGWDEDQEGRRTKAAGFDHHLVKPVEPDALQDLLASVPSPAQIEAHAGRR